MSDDEKDRINHPDRYPDPNHFDFEIDPKTGEIVDPKETAWKREKQELFHSGPPSAPETDEERDAREESEAISRMNEEYEASLPKPAHSAEYLVLRNEDENFDAIRQAMVLHCQSQPDGGALGEEVNSNPAAFLKLYKEMAQAARGRLKSSPSIAGRYRNGVRVSDDSDDSAPEEPAAPNKNEMAKLRDQIRNGKTPRERQEAEEKYTRLYFKGGR